MVQSDRNHASDERRYGRERRGNMQLDQDTDRNAQQGPATIALSDQPATTKAGKPRQRMIWTKEMNKNVMHCYYLSTKLEMVKTGYREEFHRLFTEIYPQYREITQQRLADQKRSIITNNRLTSIDIQNIKEQVAVEINTISQQSIEQSFQSSSADKSNTSILPQQTLQKSNCQTDRNNNSATNLIINVDSTIPTPDNIEYQLFQKVKTAFEANKIKWEGTDPTTRPYIPKLIFKKQTIQHIDIINNQILPTLIHDKSTLEDLHILVYVSAITTIELNEQNYKTQNKTSATSRKPKWQIRIENKINNLRKDMGRLTQFTKGNISEKVLKHIENLKINLKKPIVEIIDLQRQKLKAYAARLARYKESNIRKEQNKLFINKEKAFYKGITCKEKTDIETPTKEEITNYWKGIWSVPMQHNESAYWIQQEQLRQCNLQSQQTYITTIDELKEIVNRTHNWKCPGIDCIHNYWYKYLTSIHTQLAIAINDVIDHPHKLPNFLTIGKTYIKPKNTDTKNPSNYRPITCLPTLYKIISAMVSKKINNHLMQHNLITHEQKGCRKDSKGCKEQLVIDSVILKQTTSQQRNLHTCYIDYQKAFDSVPHSWLIKVLEIYKIHPKLIKFLSDTMKKWRTTINLTAAHAITTDEIAIKRGIFQGDSLSALWFCICLNPLSNALNETSYGYNIKSEKVTKHKINHLLYMDDIKLFAATQTQLRGLLEITETITADLKMQFGMSKCKSQHIEKGKWVEMPTETLNEETLENMEANESYKYLGFQQSTRIDHTLIKKQLCKQYEKRLILILKTHLNSKNITKAINTYAIPVLTYSFGILKWSETDLNNIEIATRKHLTRHRKLHPNSCIQRITLPRTEGGRGIIDIHNLHNNQIISLRNFFHTHTYSLHKAIILADKNYSPLNLHNTQGTFPLVTTEEKKAIWSQKQLHGRHIHIMNDANVDKTCSYTWLKKGELYPETEGFLIAIQDQVILTKNYQKYILKDTRIIDDRCRKCQINTENIDHIISGCRLLVGSEYTERHNNVAKILHQEIANNLGLSTNTSPYYEYNPENILENEEYTIYWDIAIRTDRTITHNRPDITLINKRTKTTIFIEISTPSDTNIHRKYTEKLEKYNDLTIEVKRIWKQDTVKTLPFIMSATGIVHKSFVNNLKFLNIKADIHHKIQKATILKTCNITRKFLNQQ